MKRQRILCDLDGVVVDTLPDWLAQYRMLSNDPVFEHHVKVYDFERLVKYPGLFFKTLQLGDVFRRALPMNGAIEALRFLNKHHDVEIVSYVHEDCLNGHEQKLDWLRHWAPFIDRTQVTFCYSGRKQFIAGDWLVEDSPKNIAAWLARHPEGRAVKVPHLYNAKEHLGPRCTTASLSVFATLLSMGAFDESK